MELYVVVSGAPGSGKTTLATALASEMGLPLFAKDTVKETLFDVLGAETVEESRQLGRAAIAVLLALAEANGRGVLESVWERSLCVDALRRLDGPIVEAHCACPPDVARARHGLRARHPGHFDTVRAGDDRLWVGEAARPVAGGWPVVAVDTTVPVDVAAVAEALRSAGGQAD